MIDRTWGVAAGVAGGLFIAYCVYFDRKRRNDPLFKQKLKERRKQLKNKTSNGQENDEIPDMRDYEAVQKFFIQEIQVGEELLALGDVDNGVEHLANAVSVTGQPQQLLQVLRQTLPPQIFQLLILRLPTVSQKFTPPDDTPEGIIRAAAGGGPSVVELNPLDDLE